MKVKDLVHILRGVNQDADVSSVNLSREEDLRVLVYIYQNRVLILAGDPNNPFLVGHEVKPEGEPVASTVIQGRLEEPGAKRIIQL